MESWKTIEKFPEYELSDKGRIRRRFDKPPYPAGRLLTPIHTTGISYKLMVDSIGYTVSLNKLMKEYWPELNFEIINKKNWIEKIKEINKSQNEKLQNLTVSKEVDDEYQYIPPEKRRNCIECGEDSGVDRRCKICQIKLKRQYKHSMPTGYTLML